METFPTSVVTPALLKGKRRPAPTPIAQPQAPEQRWLIYARCDGATLVIVAVDFTYESTPVVGPSSLQFVPSQPERIDALTRCVEELRKSVPPETVLRVALDIWERADRTSVLRFINSRPNTSQFDRKPCRAGHCASNRARNLVDAQRVHRSVYTDGSMRRNGTKAAVAWVDLDGGCWFSTLKVYSVFEAEFIAICRAIMDSSRRVASVNVYSDSRRAVKAVNRAIRTRRVEVNGVAVGACSRLLAFLARRGDLTVSVMWIRGHSGNVFNECADRLAVMARRHLEAGIDLEETKRRAEAITAGALQQYHELQLAA